jgi:lysozyme
LRYSYDLEGLGLTEREESLRLVSYQDQAKVWTVGYGHTGSDVYPGQVITREQAAAWLQQDTKTASDAVNRYVTVPITQENFDALTDLAYNIGVHAFANSTLLKLLNQRNYAGAEAAFKQWVFVKGTVNQGLWNRRQAEQGEFMSGGLTNG